MQPPPQDTTLARFRADLYTTALGKRKDSLCDLLDAVLTADGPRTLARLSLAPGFRRRWASVSDALAAGEVHLDVVRPLLVRHLPERRVPASAPTAAAPLPGGDARRPVWAVDGSTWPRPQAKTSPERTWGRQVHAGLPQDGVVPAWEYQWLVAVPLPGQSWVLPLDVVRRSPTAGTPTQLALDQLARVLPHAPAGQPRPVVAFDSGYDPVAFVRAQQQGKLAADVLVRLAGHRVFYRQPPPYAGQGRPRKHGAVFRCKDATTHGPPDHQTQWADPERGTMTVAVWAGLHTQKAPDAPFTVVRITMERLPRRDTPPQPLWLAWIAPDGATGPTLPDDLALFWPWYGQRFPIEHGFRFAKQTLGWTTVRPRDPAAADRWTWRVVLTFWQLWLARPLVADHRLPWERPVPLDALTPGRVRRAFPGLLPMLSTPARASKPRGKSPGRRLGQRPPPHARCAVQRRQPPPAKPRRRKRPGRRRGRKPTATR
jgi:hypothetical protein